MGIRSKIAMLPAAVRTELDRRIVERAFSEILTDRVSLLKLLLRQSNYSPKPRNQQKPARVHLKLTRAHLKPHPAQLEPSQTHLKPSQTRLNPLSRSSPHLTAFTRITPSIGCPFSVGPSPARRTNAARPLPTVGRGKDADPGVRKQIPAD